MAAKKDSFVLFNQLSSLCKVSMQKKKHETPSSDHNLGSIFWIQQIQINFEELPVF